MVPLQAASLISLRPFMLRASRSHDLHVLESAQLGPVCKAPNNRPDGSMIREANSAEILPGENNRGLGRLSSLAHLGAPFVEEACKVRSFCGRWN
jgi:hypothetical protein